MAKKKDDIKNMKPGELEKKLETLRAEVRKIKFQAEGARSKNVKELSNLRKGIARILTELSRAQEA